MQGSQRPFNAYLAVGLIELPEYAAFPTLNIHAVTTEKPNFAL